MGVKPNCKIEVYDTSDALDQTLTSDILECNTKDIATSGIGTFNFLLPAQKGVTQVYNDIGDNYRVKIYFGYDGSYTHLFSGKIVNHTTRFSKQGSLRYFEGKSYGEILERRLKWDKRWQGWEADDIVADLCGSSNLDISSSIATDTTAETITATCSSYFDLFQRISDYYDGGGSVQKDFWVDKSGVFQWKARPLRTSGVESFTLGTHFDSYELRYDIKPVKNSIWVKGAALTHYPSDSDLLTESLDNWTSINGTLSLESASPQVGTYNPRITGETNIGMLLTLPKRIFLRDINHISLYYRTEEAVGATSNIRLYAPDVDNMFQAVLPHTASGWLFFDETLGDSAMSPSGVWSVGAGSPNWWDIQAVAVIHGNAAGTLWIDADGLSFYPERCAAYASDATSITNYETRQAEYTDDTLLSESECQQRANSLLTQLKNRQLRLDFTVQGNTNVLLGDQLTMTLPPDDVTSQAFDVVSVTNSYQKDTHYLTSVSALYSADNRQLPAKSPLELVQQKFDGNRQTQADLYSKIVR